MISHDDLLALMAYDPDTGTFHWREYRYPRREDLLVGFRNDEGYLKTKIGRKTYSLHRLAWLYIHGEWPSDQVDHINGVRDDNRLCNLRLASQSENRINSAVNANNKLGIRGVRKTARGLGYAARITKDGRQIHLGYFKTPEEARAARAAATKLLHGEFAPKR